MAELADLLADAWRQGSLFAKPDSIPWPADRAAAYAVQDRMAELIGAQAIGWKVGATSPGIQRAEGFDGPIPGRVLAERTVASGGKVDARLCPHAKLEAEIAFRLREDQAPPSDAPDAADAFDMLLAADITSTRYEPGTVPQESLLRQLAGIADNGNGGYIVLGPQIDPSAGMPLMGYPLSITVNGEERCIPFEGDCRPDPKAALAWVLAMLEQRGLRLGRGDVVLTGSANRPMPLAGGSEVLIRVQDAGDVQIAFA